MNGRENKKVMSEFLELQRYGRNKSTLVNKIYINSGEYRKKFDMITDDIEMNRKTSKENKTFMCDYNIVFREIYRLEQRRIERLGISEYMVLFTVDNDAINERGDKLTVLLNKAIDILGEAIENTLRSGDIASRCSELQYIALLPNCPENMIDTVVGRILDTYEKEVCKQNLYIKFKRNNIHIDYAIKSISKGNVLSI